MSKNTPIITTLIAIALIFFAAEFFLVREYFCPLEENLSESTEAKENNQSPQAMIVLIEFQQTDGLVNMVNDMKERDIYGLLMVTPEFVEDNTEAIKSVVDTGNVEIVASYVKEPLWDISYDEQYEIITDMIDRIEKALDIDVRVVSSRYMASDETTVKVAEELGIEYVMARGTTELAMTVYKPEEYNVRILSVSNIDTPEFKYGSLCDYSYYERAGTPEDMLKDLKRAADEDKFFAVSHTYIGGFKERWNNMWHDFWDNNDIDWVDLDTISSVDKNLPMWQIPINKNAPYTPEKIRPLIPYEEEQNVENPCSVEELGQLSETVPEETTEINVVMFHNNTGPMCIDALEFFEENNIEYEEHLTTDSDFSSLLNSYKAEFSSSEGVSSSFGYYPIIFVGEKAYSGFDEQIGSEIKSLLTP